MSQSRVANQVSCAVCAFNPLCHSRAAHIGAPSPVEERRRLTRGDTLYAAGSPNDTLFAVRAGFMKAVSVQPNGLRHTVRFLFPGNIAGLDGCATGRRVTEAVALDDCEVCKISTHRIDTIADFSPTFSAHMRRLLAHEVADAHEHSAALACLPVRARVAHFVLSLGDRWKQRGFSATSFRLPMTRVEIAAHLALTPETLSRELTWLARQGLLRHQRRSIEILDPPALRALIAGGNAATYRHEEAAEESMIS
ncbi:MAG: Crp/Fnr family transcriptional regulator [Usitatibacter sp.]